MKSSVVRNTGSYCLLFAVVVEVEVEILSPVNQQHRRGRLGRRAHWSSGLLVGDCHGNRNYDHQTMIIKE